MRHTPPVYLLLGRRRQLFLWTTACPPVYLLLGRRLVPAVSVDHCLCAARYLLFNIAISEYWKHQARNFD